MLHPAPRAAPASVRGPLACAAGRSAGLRAASATSRAGTQRLHEDTLRLIVGFVEFH